MWSGLGYRVLGCGCGDHQGVCKLLFLGIWLMFFGFNFFEGLCLGSGLRGLSGCRGLGVEWFGIWDDDGLRVWGWVWGEGCGVWGVGCGLWGVGCFWERERTVVDLVLGSERERDPDILEELGPSIHVPHLVQPHVRCHLFLIRAVFF